MNSVSRELPRLFDNATKEGKRRMQGWGNSSVCISF